MANRHRYRFVLLPLLLLCGCADSAPPTASAPPESPAGTPPPAGQAPPAGSPAAAVPAGVPGVAAAPGLPAGPVATMQSDPSFTPLPSPDQVKRAQPIGQLDPFRPLSRELQDLVVKPNNNAAKARLAALQSARSARPQPLASPPGWQLSGLIGGAGRPEAVVSYMGASGTLREGDVGSASGKGANATNLLPDGWRVGEIDPNRGTIVLEFKGRKTMKQI